MLVAKASTADLQCLEEIVSFCESLHGGWMPQSICLDSSGDEGFDPDDSVQSLRAISKLLEITGSASAGRAVLNLVVLLDPTSQVLADSDVVALHPRFSQTSGWVPLVGAGQINPGDYLSFTLSGKPVCVKAQQVLATGTDREEVIYNRKRNHYFITAMALDGTSSHKDVYVRSAVAGGAQ